MVMRPPHAWWILHLCLIHLGTGFRPDRHWSSITPVKRTLPCATSLDLLLPLSAGEAERLLSTGPPTGAQYATYWGRTRQERYGRFLESTIVGFLGVFFSYFLSFVVGSFFATILGCMFFFWGVLSPEFQAYQRNWEFLGGRPLVDSVGGKTREGLFSAILVGHIADFCVVETAGADAEEYDLDDFDDYTMESDELERLSGRPYLLRVMIRDQTGRELQVHTRLSEEYVGGVLDVGLPVLAVLLSTDPDFTRLAALTDLHVPDANLWLGDYPYLDRDETRSLLAKDNEVWEALESETLDTDDTDSDHANDDFLQQEDLVPVYRRNQ